MNVTTAASPGSPGLRLSTPRGRWVVAATVLGSGMAALDATVVGIALPAIGRDFHAGIGRRAHDQPALPTCLYHSIELFQDDSHV